MTGKRTARTIRTRPVGEGGDGAQWGVTRIETGGGSDRTVRRKPCATCPWRIDAPIGFFPPEAYRSSASTAYDASLTTFACHESGAAKPATCAGFLLTNSANNLAVRLSLSMDRFELDRVGNPEGVELYPSYRAMAIANGVAEDDPRIAACRADDEDGFTVADRVRATAALGGQCSQDADDFLRRALDEDGLDL